MKSLLVAVLLQIFYLFSSVKNENTNDLILRKVFCEGSPEFVSNLSCAVKICGRNKYTLDMKLDIIKSLQNISVDFKSFKFYNGFRPFIINFKGNACNYLARKSFHPLAGIAIKLLKKFSNVNHSCPFKGHIAVKNATYYPGIFPSIIPSGRYKGVLHVFEGYPPKKVGGGELFADVYEI